METHPGYNKLPANISMMELFLLAKAQPHHFPNWAERTRVLETSLLNSRGFFQSPVSDANMGIEDFERGELLPVVSY